MKLRLKVLRTSEVEVASKLRRGEPKVATVELEPDSRPALDGRRPPISQLTGARRYLRRTCASEICFASPRLLGRLCGSSVARTSSVTSGVVKTKCADWPLAGTPRLRGDTRAISDPELRGGASGIP